MNCSCGDLQVSLCFNFFKNYFELEFIYHSENPKRSLEGHTTSTWTASPEFRKPCIGAPCQCVIELLASCRRSRIVHTGHGHKSLIFVSSDSSSSTVRHWITRSIDFACGLSISHFSSASKQCIFIFDITVHISLCISLMINRTIS